MDPQLERSDGIRDRPGAHLSGSAADDERWSDGAMEYRSVGVVAGVMRAYRGAIAPRPRDIHYSITPALVCSVVQGNARPYPRVVLVEIDAHHFALAHSNQVVNQDRILILLRPQEHHSQFGF